MSTHTTEITLVLTAYNGEEVVHVLTLGERIDLATVPVEAIEVRAVTERRTEP